MMAQSQAGYLLRMLTYAEMMIAHMCISSLASRPDSTTPSAASSVSSSPKTPSDTPVARTVKGDEMRVKPTGNTPRDKTIEMMYAAIGLGSFAGMSNCCTIGHF